MSNYTLSEVSFYPTSLLLISECTDGHSDAGAADTTESTENRSLLPEKVSDEIEFMETEEDYTVKNATEGM